MASQDILEKRIALLSGGWSDEREVSLASGDAVARALAMAGFTNVVRVDVAKPGFAAALEQGGFDVAFIAMHGRGGEDGCVQGLLETLRIPHTFSGVLASAMAADKEIAKTVLNAAGIPVPGGVAIEQGEDWTVGQVIAATGLPAFVKPATNGSSYGVSKVTEASQLERAVADAFERDDKVLVEACIEGTEITVPVVGNAHPRALPIVEIVTGAEFYDLKVKYEPTELHHVIPARLSPEVYAHAQELAIKAHRALGCAGVSRSDFIITSDGTPYILETNTIPGMTEASLLPDSARHDGEEFPQLCREFVELALGVCE